MSVCFKRSAAAFKFHMPLPGPAGMLTRGQVLSQLDEADRKPTDKTTASDAIKRRERESVEVIKKDTEVATSKAISSKTRASWRQWLSAAEKEALAQKKAVAAAVAKPEEKEIKRSRTR